MSLQGGHFVGGFGGIITRFNKAWIFICKCCFYQQNRIGFCVGENSQLNCTTEHYFFYLIHVAVHVVHSESRKSTECNHVLTLKEKMYSLLAYLRRMLSQNINLPKRGNPVLLKCEAHVNMEI